jgi:hypothetical protein
MSHNIALLPLDFAGLFERHCARNGRANMDRAIIQPAIKLLLTEIHTKLNEAARIAKAAEACALAGSIAEGVTLSMDIRGGAPAGRRLAA